MSRRVRALVVVASACAAFLIPISPASAVTITAPGDTNGYCNQNITYGTGVTVTDSITGTTCVVKFTGVGTYTWYRPAYVTNFRALIVGGGGGGGGDYGGGGGAGGFIDTNVVLPVATLTSAITVGNGGSGNAGGGTTTDASGAANGETSTALSISRAGGGGGGSPDMATDSLRDGRAGASGGGSGRAGIGTGKSGISGQGNNGGGSNYTGGVTVMSGGGGGAFQVGATGGTDVSQTIGGKGGDGSTSNITGVTLTYAGGGGGGTHSSGNTCVRGTASVGLTGGGAYGGAGGGGDGGQCINAGGSASTGNAGANGTANTGGGGGGGSVYNGRTTDARGGNGGSGIVIISYTYVSSISPVLTLPNGQSLIYRTLITLSAISPTAGTVTFYAAGKKIPGCINRPTTVSGSNNVATCPWRPSVHGAVKISALIDPTDAAGTNTWGSTSFEPVRRTGNR